MGWNLSQSGEFWEKLLGFPGGFWDNWGDRICWDLGFYGICGYWGIWDFMGLSLWDLGYFGIWELMDLGISWALGLFQMGFYGIWGYSEFGILWNLGLYEIWDYSGWDFMGFAIIADLELFGEETPGKFPPSGTAEIDPELGFPLSTRGLVSPSPLINN